MRGDNSLVSIIITKETKLSLIGQLHRMLGTLLSPFSCLIIVEVPPHAPQPPPSPQIIILPSINNHWGNPQALFQGFIIEAPPLSPHSVQAKSLYHDL